MTDLAQRAAAADAVGAQRPLVAALQMTSGPDVAANLATATRLLRAAAEAGASVAVLPENFSFMGMRDADKLAVADFVIPNDSDRATLLARTDAVLDAVRAWRSPSSP